MQTQCFVTLFFQKRRTSIADPETELYLSLSVISFLSESFIEPSTHFQQNCLPPKALSSSSPLTAGAASKHPHARARAQTWPRSAPSIMSKGLTATCGGCRRGQISQSPRRRGDKHLGGERKKQTRQPAMAGTQHASFPDAHA